MTAPTAEPVELPVTLLPGAVILHCSECTATMAGWPGESLEHADGGAHVWHASLTSGPTSPRSPHATPTARHASRQRPSSSLRDGSPSQG